jgi:hypothetical protein
MPRRSTGVPDATETSIRPPATAETRVRPVVATLTVIAPPTAAGRQLAINPTGTTIGRSPSCNLVLPGDQVSRLHAEVRMRAGGFEIEDRGSANGTRVNDEPITGPHRLRSGDMIDLADIQIRFSYGVPAPAANDSLRQGLREAPGFSLPALLLAVAGSVVGTVLPGVLGTDAWGALAGAAVGPVVSSVFSTRYTGEHGRIRAAAIVVLSLAALLITVTGFTLGDRATGGSVLPGNDRTSTFPDLTDDTTTTPDDGGDTGGGASPSASSPAAIVEPAAVACGDVPVGSEQGCPVATIRYHGSDRLHVTSVELRGDAAGDFTAAEECVDHWLDPEQSCEMTVTFHPSAAGDRTATLVVHQNLPRPDHGTIVQVTGTGTGTDPDTCLPGFVWREAVTGDKVCVTPETRDQTAADNAQADARRSPTGGDYGPDTCLDGFVWRVATPADLVCVPPETRDQAASDNAAAASRRTG